jgi:hypothetical protein
MQDWVEQSGEHIAGQVAVKISPAGERQAGPEYWVF